MYDKHTTCFPVLESWKGRQRQNLGNVWTDSKGETFPHTEGFYRASTTSLKMIQTMSDNSKSSLIHIQGSNICAQVTQILVILFFKNNN